MAVRNSNKYDRQLRIWGDQGQIALEQSKICLLNCGPTGAEALKNLVLGGIGSFTIVDASKVEAKDLGNNFFVDCESNGLSKAKTVTTFLRELNDSVEGKYVEESPETLLDSNPTYFSNFTLVIATQMQEQLLLRLDKICRQQNVILLIARSYGLTGIVRISLNEHCVIESKTDNAMSDLRLQKPWQELKSFADQLDTDINDSMIHKHIPFAVLLIKAAEEWQKTHGSLPSTNKEKTEFKSLLASKKRGGDEENYKEALSSAYKVWSPPIIGPDLEKVLNDDATEVNSNSSDFWIMVAALKEFIANEGEGDLPLEGSIPDMTSTTEYYVTLQKIYQEKAEADVSAVEARIKNILKQIGKNPASISRSTVKLFCKNARYIRVFRYPTLEEELKVLAGNELQKHLTMEGNSDMSPAENGAELIMGGEAKEKSSLPRTMDINGTIYILLRAVDQFAKMYNRYPGVFEEEREEDAVKLRKIASSLTTEMVGSGGITLSDDIICETCRFGASEIHTVASIIGGIASQEVIKLITKQFTPLHGTLVYNGIDSTTTVLQF